ncbi:MAG TPA: hypothetical protein VNH64_05760, partial [Parvularculaceae bacterium]|nr:hypothetical protein [Parvularculaceae bacterium]
MKSLGDAGFFRVFDALAGDGNPGLVLKSWTHEGADWRRDRTSLSSPEYSFIAEVFTLAHAARPKWTLLVVKEHWWAGEEKNAIKSARWARPMAGRKADILAWFRAREEKGAP